MICIALVYAVDYIVREQHILIRSVSVFFVCVIVATCKVYYRYIRKTRKENCKSTARHNVYDEDYYRVRRSHTRLSRDYECSKAENDDLRKRLKEKDSHIARMTKNSDSVTKETRRKDSEIERLKRTLSQSMEESSSLRQANGRKDNEIEVLKQSITQLREESLSLKNQLTSIKSELRQVKSEKVMGSLPKLQEACEEAASAQPHKGQLKDVHRDQDTKQLLGSCVTHEETVKIQGLELKRLQEQLATREKEVTSLNNELSTKQTELQEQLATREEEVTSLNNELSTKQTKLQEQLATREKEVTSLNNELSTKETELQEVRQKLAAHQEELTTLADQMIHKEQELEHHQEILATVQEQVYQGLDELFISHDEALSQLEEAVYLNFLLNHSLLSTFSCARAVHVSSISYSIDK